MEDLNNFVMLALFLILAVSYLLLRVVHWACGRETGWSPTNFRGAIEGHQETGSP
jgi:hypothetical protein